MVTPALSVAPQQPSLSAEAALDAIDQFGQPQNDAEQLRGAHADLEQLYAIEQHIAGTEEWPALIGAVLPRLLTLTGAEAVAIVTCDAHTAEVSSLKRGGPVRRRALERSQALAAIARVMSAARVPELEPGEVEPLDEVAPLPSAAVYAAPFSDANAQRGALHAIMVGQTADEALLRRLTLASQQLGRAALLRRERSSARRAQDLTLLGRSVSAILHELRTPLSAVAGYVDDMASEDSSELRRQYADRAGRALDHMEQMAHELLAFARGQREVTVRSVQLQSFSDEVRELLAPELERSGTHLEIKLEYAGIARFDAPKLRRVLWDLGRNAAQAGAKQFSWTIERAGEYLIFECLDDGSGVPSMSRPRPLDWITGSDQAESGLGLAITKTIVDAHCGRLHMSTGASQGTLFRIELPI
jgi:signal transduction histidine kinase